MHAVESRNSWCDTRLGQLLKIFIISHKVTSSQSDVDHDAHVSLFHGQSVSQRLMSSGKACKALETLHCFLLWEVLNPPLRAQCSLKLQLPLMRSAQPSAWWHPVDADQPSSHSMMMACPEKLINPSLRAWRWPEQCIVRLSEPDGVLWNSSIHFSELHDVLRNLSVHVSEHDDVLWNSSIHFSELRDVLRNLSIHVPELDDVLWNLPVWTPTASFPLLKAVSQPIHSSGPADTEWHLSIRFLKVRQHPVTLASVHTNYNVSLFQTCQSLHLSFPVTSCEIDQSISRSWPDDVKWNITQHRLELSELDTVEQNLLVFTQTAVSFAKNCQSVHNKAWRHWVKLACHRTSCTVSFAKSGVEFSRGLITSSNVSMQTAVPFVYRCQQHSDFVSLGVFWQRFPGSTLGGVSAPWR